MTEQVCSRVQKAVREMQDYWVTVCDQCLTASCYHGVFMCQRSNEAETVRMRASVLDALNLEHRDNYSKDRLTAVCGGVEFIPRQSPKAIEESNAQTKKEEK